MGVGVHGFQVCSLVRLLYQFFAVMLLQPVAKLPEISRDGFFGVLRGKVFPLPLFRYLRFLAAVVVLICPLLHYSVDRVLTSPPIRAAGLC